MISSGKRKIDNLKELERKEIKGIEGRDNNVSVNKQKYLDKKEYERIFESSGKGLRIRKRRSEGLSQKFLHLIKFLVRLIIQQQRAMTSLLNTRGLRSVIMKK